MKDKDGMVLFGPHQNKRHWEEYFQALLNNGTDDSEYPREVVRSPVEPVSEVEIQQALKAMHQSGQFALTAFQQRCGGWKG